ncbi:MAG: dihydroxy-acid dehydratase, partial [Acutalibacteraceae bacterium]
LLRALGLSDTELTRPFIGVVCSKSDYIPGHKHLGEIAEAVKAGIRNAGGVPIEFETIGVCDGLAMGHQGMKYSLCSRELIADSIEVMLTAHPLDAAFIPNAINCNRYDYGSPPFEFAKYFCKRRTNAAGQT